MLSVSIRHYFILIEGLSVLSRPLSNDIKTCELKLDPTWLVLKPAEAESRPKASSQQPPDRAIKAVNKKLT